jgi:hypothetical protein
MDAVRFGDPGSGLEVGRYALARCGSCRDQRPLDELFDAVRQDLYWIEANTRRECQLPAE